MKYTDFKLFEVDGTPIDFATYETVGVSARILDAVAARCDIDRNRINFTPTYFHSTDFVPLKAFVFDGHPTDFVWTPEFTAPLEARTEEVADAEAQHLNDVINKLIDYLKDAK